MQAGDPVRGAGRLWPALKPGRWPFLPRPSSGPGRSLALITWPVPGLRPPRPAHAGRGACGAGQESRSLGQAFGQVFGDEVLATAILDRLLHHIDSPSHRLKNRLIAGENEAGVD